MDLDTTARYSVELVSPTTPVYKSEQEDVTLLPGGSLSDPEKSRRGENLGNINPVRQLLAALTLLSSLLAAAGWILYWCALPGLPLAGEINGLVPEFPVRRVLFDEDPLSTPDHKTAESINATYDHWVSFMPVGNGFMPVEHNGNHILPPPMISVVNGLEYESYSIAVFHQLHCLHSVMKMWNKVNDELELAKRGQLQNRVDTEEVPHHDPRRHVDHCFRYLRQSIVCCADTALEGQNPRVNTPDTDGTGATHLCKDFEQVKGWAQKHRLRDSHWI